MERKYIITVTTTNRFLITVELEKNELEQIKSNRFKDIISVIKQQKKDVKLAIVTLLIYIISLSIGIFLNTKIAIVVAFMSLFSTNGLLLLNKFTIIKENKRIINWLAIVVISFGITVICDGWIQLQNWTILGNVLTSLSLFIMISGDIFKDLLSNNGYYTISPK